MSEYSDHPVYWINKWITQELRDKSIIPVAAEYAVDLEDQTDFILPFMMPSQQNSESSTPWNEGHYKSLPFCVWTVEQVGGHDQPWNKHGNATYIFYDGAVAKLIEISNFVHDLTNREDWSADDINYKYRNDTNFPWEFQYICFTSGTGPAPASDEGGRNAYMCIIEYQAIYAGTGRVDNYDVNGFDVGIGRLGNENGGLNKVIPQLHHNNIYKIMNMEESKT